MRISDWSSDVCASDLTEKAVRGADAALFMIDGRAGVTPLDEEIARWLRSEDTPIILLVNKAEGKQGENGLMESYSLGFDNPIALSAEHGEGVVDLFDALRPIVEGHDAEGADALPSIEGEDDEDAPLGPMKLAIVGRPNRSEEHTSEIQSLMRISYAVFCLKIKKTQ